MAKMLQAEIARQSSINGDWGYINPWQAYWAGRAQLRPWSIGSGIPVNFSAGNDPFPYRDYGIDVKIRARIGNSNSSYGAALAAAQSAAWYVPANWGTNSFAQAATSYAYSFGVYDDPPDEDIWLTKSWQAYLSSFKIRFPVPFTGRLRLRYGLRMVPSYNGTTGEPATAPAPSVFSDVVLEPTWLPVSSSGANTNLYRAPAQDKYTGGAAFASHRMTPALVTRDQKILGTYVSGLNLTVTASEVKVVAIRVLPTDVAGVSPYVRVNTAIPPEPAPKVSPVTIEIVPATGDDTGGGATAEFRLAEDGFYYPVITNPGANWKRLPKLKINGVDMGENGSARLMMSGGDFKGVVFNSYTAPVGGGFYGRDCRGIDCVWVLTDWVGQFQSPGYFLARAVVGTESFDSVEWDGVVPEGYNLYDRETWPETDWIDLPLPAVGESWHALMPAIDLDW